jgi:hypothetical protein
VNGTRLLGGVRWWSVRAVVRFFSPDSRADGSWVVIHAGSRRGSRRAGQLTPPFCGVGTKQVGFLSIAVVTALFWGRVFVAIEDREKRQVRKVPVNSQTP